MENTECKVVHSESKSAWNVVGTVAGGKYKLARVLYNVDSRMSDELNMRERKEALEIAKFTAQSLKRARDIEYIFSQKEK